MIILISKCVRLGLPFIKTTIIVVNKLVVYRLTDDPVTLFIPCVVVDAGVELINLTAVEPPYFGSVTVQILILLVIDVLG